MLQAKQIEQNWNSLIQLIEDNFSGERKENLLKMYNHLKDRMMFAPASSKEHFHNAFPGGYVEHVLNITRAVKSVYQTWKDHGAHINFTEEEMIFATLHHDLGKVGDDEMDYYIPNESEWHRKNLGKELAKYNIAVNAITPAGAKTKILDQMSKEHVQWMLSKVPRGRFLEINELSSMVCWLSSEENSFSTAAVFDISGGRSTY